MKTLRENIEYIMKEVADEEGYNGAIDVSYWIEHLCEKHGVTKEEVISMQDKINADRMSAKAKVIIDEGDDLKQSQIELLNSEFGEDGWEMYSLKNKLTLEQQDEELEKLQGNFKKQSKVVFATNSFPYLMTTLSNWSNWEYVYMLYKHIYGKKEKSQLSWKIIKQNDLYSLIDLQ